jgi:transcriptional regulator with XRE-family HTH domain
VPIGESLARARHQAGLTVAQVSRQTRIRETIIRGIENDDYSECGGDFYSRGHIRAIAKAVGADAEPLIQEYDTRHRAPGAVGTVSLEELLAASGRAGQRHPPDLPAALGRVTAAAAAPVRRMAGMGVAGGQMPSGRNAPRRTAKWAVFVGLALVIVVAGFVALRHLAGPPPVEASAAAGKHPVSGHDAGPSHPRPAAKSSHRAARTSPAKAAHSPAPPPAAQPAQALAPVQASAFGPNGGDNPQLARLAISGRHSAGWHTDWYSSPRFGNLYPGTGLLLTMSRAVAITSVQIDLGNATGASLQLRVGTKPALPDLRPVAHASGAGGLVRLHLARPASGRYVLVWFTKLPADSSGQFQASVLHVALQGRG